jgi:hypothetical protein
MAVVARCLTPKALHPPAQGRAAERSYPGIRVAKLSFREPRRGSIRFPTRVPARCKCFFVDRIPRVRHRWRSPNPGLEDGTPLGFVAACRYLCLTPKALHPPAQGRAAELPWDTSRNTIHSGNPAGVRFDSRRFLAGNVLRERPGGIGGWTTCTRLSTGGTFRGTRTVPRLPR